MAAVSTELLETIIELQNLPSLKETYLGGGTNLALRYNHRVSIDIDLFFSGIIGKSGYQWIEKEVKDHLGDRAKFFTYPCEEDDQYIFMRFEVLKRKVAVKVEIMQNANFLYPAEIVMGAKLATAHDIGMMKLMTAANRGSLKDIYDLDYITDEIPLTVLFAELKAKQLDYAEEKYKTIFGLDAEVSPVDNPLRLLLFEDMATIRADRPAHSNFRVDIEPGHKNLMQVKTSYRRKVRHLCNDLGIEFPGINPVN